MPMTEHVWIDGFNLFHKWENTRELMRRGGDIVAGQESALAALGAAAGNLRQRIVVFMDGGLTREANSAHGLRLQWAGPGGKADDAIGEALQGKRGRTGNVTVVTDDRALAQMARSHGAKTASTATFLAALERRAPRRRPRSGSQLKHRRLSELEIAAWLEVFGGAETEEQG